MRSMGRQETKSQDFSKIDQFLELLPFISLSSLARSALSMSTSAQAYDRNLVRIGKERVESVSGTFFISSLNTSRAGFADFEGRATWYRSQVQTSQATTPESLITGTSNSFALGSRLLSTLSVQQPSNSI